MESSESLQQFYTRTQVPVSSSGLANAHAGLGHFNVFSRDDCALVTPYSRRDYYKISLIIGKGKLHYANKWIYVDRPALLFSNPLIPYSWEGEDEDQTGWFCLFTDQFLQNGNRLGHIQDSQLFKIGGTPIFF